MLTLPAGTVTGTPLEETQITLLDTPGHVDFSAEAERTLQALDYAVLVISGTDGIQSHTMTLWRLLERYHVPTFIYVNKMDLPGADKAMRLRELRAALGMAVWTLPPPFRRKNAPKPLACAVNR